MSDALDIEDPAALLAYLRGANRIRPDEELKIRILAGGVSNRTVLVERPSGEAWVLKQALPKLRVAVDWFSDPARIRREALALRWLPKLAPPGTITPLVFEDPAHYLLAMQAVPQPHENWKTMLLAGRVIPRHVRQFGRLLGQIHRGALRAARRAGRRLRRPLVLRIPARRAVLRLHRRRRSPRPPRSSTQLIARHARPATDAGSRRLQPEEHARPTAAGSCCSTTRSFTGATRRSTWASR